MKILFFIAPQFSSHGVSHSSVRCHVTARSRKLQPRFMRRCFDNQLLNYSFIIVLVPWEQFSIWIATCNFFPSFCDFVDLTVNLKKKKKRRFFMISRETCKGPDTTGSAVCQALLKAVNTPESCGADMLHGSRLSWSACTPPVGCCIWTLMCFWLWIFQ